METKDIVLLAVTLAILGEVTYLLAKLPKTTIKSKQRVILVDTSVIMDGRIVGVAATGFIGGTLVIPRSVVGELQFLADNADADKRARARRGLDVVTELQHMDGIDVELLQDGSKAEEGVDERLLSLAKQHNAVICTVDYNLNKVAVVEGIQVLNLNELAQQLRLAHLPGEQMMIELVQKGQDSHQGVGYLPDGTMVVVEQSSAIIGQTVHVEVVRSLQTAAGKMMFARRVDTTSPPQPLRKKPTEHVGAKTKSHGRQPVDKRQPVGRAEKSKETAKSESKVRPQRSQQTFQRTQRRSENLQSHQDKHERPVRQRRLDREDSLLASIERQK